MTTAYSPHKIVHHESKLKELKAGRQTTPLQLQIVPTNRCNHSCKLCAYRLEGSTSNEAFNPLDELSIHQVLSVLHDCADMGIKAVQFTGGGEPTAHPEFARMLDTALALNLDAAVVSNGQNIDEHMAALIGQGAWSRISFDASTEQTFSTVHRGGHFTLVKEAVRKIAMHKKQGHILGVGFVVQADNFSEIHKAAELAKELGADNFRISAAFTPDGLAHFGDFFEMAQAMAKQTKADLEDNSFHVFNMFDDRVGDMFSGSQQYKYCPVKDLMAYLGADGNLYTCCTKAYSKAGLIGSVVEGLDVLWNSGLKKRMFAHHTPKQACQHPCMYEGKNKFINYCLSECPEHVNFI